jgi:hypothetical protein
MVIIIRDGASTGEPRTIKRDDHDNSPYTLLDQEGRQMSYFNEAEVKHVERVPGDARRVPLPWEPVSPLQLNSAESKAIVAFENYRAAYPAAYEAATVDYNKALTNERHELANAVKAHIDGHSKRVDVVGDSIVVRTTSKSSGSHMMAANPVAGETAPATTLQTRSNETDTI